MVAPLRFLARGAYAIPHASKAHRGGEDAFYLHAEGRSVGVADGVGGWADSGVNPAIYARKLMSSALGCFLSSSSTANDSLTALSKAYTETTKAKITGSCTAAIATVDKESGRKLSMLHVGDCGVVVLRRNGDVIYRSEEQQIKFNFPLQLGTGSPTTPKDGVHKVVDAEPFDLVLLGSDGLFDNLFDENIIDTMRKYQSATKPPAAPVVDCARLAKELCDAAYQASVDERKASPFSTKAKQSGYRYHGGKPDDITAVVAQLLALSSEVPAEHETLKASRKQPELIDDIFPDTGGSSVPPKSKL